MGESFRPFPYWLLPGVIMGVLGLLPAVNTIPSSTEKLNVLSALRGETVNISCNYSFTDRRISVSLKRNSKVLCTKSYTNQQWIGRECSDHFRILWNNETTAISFMKQELQINDSDIYTCEMIEMLPVIKLLSSSKTFLTVTARPTVFVSCMEGTNSQASLLCSSQDFYPDGLQQVWLHDGQLRNTKAAHTFLSAKMDGSFTINTSITLPSDPAKDEVYTCWVNHSTLSQPITVNYTLSDCREQRNVFPAIYVIALVCGVVSTVLAIGIITASGYKIKKAPHSQSPASPETTEVKFYSTPGNHHPVQLHKSWTMTNFSTP